MCQWRTFAELVRTAPKSDIAVLVLTFVLTIVFDLWWRSRSDCCWPVCCFYEADERVAEAKSWRYVGSEEEAEQEKLRALPPHVNVYS